MIEKILQEYITTSLSNQWEPSLPIPADIFQSSWPFITIDFDADFSGMLAECKANQDLFVGHRQLDKHLSYGHEGWSAVTLHGIDYDKTEHWTQYGYKSFEDANYRWTTACERLPLCTEFVKSLGYDLYDRVRIMKLDAGGYIMPHCDGTGRIFGPLNIAINNPENCEFYFGKYGKVPFTTGRGVFLDIGNEHMVWNNSNEDRYHFIVHGHINPKLFDKAINQLRKKYE